MIQKRNQAIFAIVLFTLTVVNVYGQQQSTNEQTKSIQDSIKKANQAAQSNVNMFTEQLTKDLLDKTKQIEQITKNQQNSMQKLEEIDRQLKTWNQILKKFSQAMGKVNGFLTVMNEKMTAVMGRVVGFEEELKAVISLDTLVVCLLSLILIKILKDEFMQDGYQPLSSPQNTHQPLSANSVVNTTLSEMNQ